MRKKIIIVLLAFLVIGCGEKSVDKKLTETPNIKGYWVQTIRDSSGDIDDMTNNPYTYLEIGNDKLTYYVLSADKDEGITESKKYYRLEGNKLYYDYNELKGENWKDNIDELAGGIFEVSFQDNNLVLTELFNEKDKKDGYEQETYKKIDQNEWPIEK